MKYAKRRTHSESRPMAEINVTPLVDVMLVLLIIFMVTAPMLQMGIDVNLPRVKALLNRHSANIAFAIIILVH